MALKDRLATARVARAVMAPSGILLGGLAASVGIATGLPIAVAAALGAVAYAGKVALAVPRDRDRGRVDPARLAEPWRTFVREAQDAHRRYQAAVRTAPAGPLRQRLEGLATRIAEGVDESWRIARRGDQLDRALVTLEIDRVRSELAQVEAAPAGAWTASAGREQTLAALRAQVGSHDRLARVAGDARDRLRVLDARLDEAVARAIEFAQATGDAPEWGTLGSDVDTLVTEMEGLRQAMEETWAS